MVAFIRQTRNGILSRPIALKAKCMLPQEALEFAQPVPPRPIAATAFPMVRATHAAVGQNGRLPFKVCHSPLLQCFVISFAQQALRKPVCAGTSGAGSIAEIVNREGARPDYENRRKTNSGGQRI